MRRYAAGTEVSVEKSRAEIERTLSRYGATAFASGWEGRRAVIQFRAAGRHVRFMLELPDPGADEFARSATGRKARTPEQARNAWEQACRASWRALALVIKAKLEAVEARIVTFEEEFLPHVVLPDGMTVWEKTRDAVALAYSSGETPKLIPDYGGRT